MQELVIKKMRYRKKKKKKPEQVGIFYLTRWNWQKQKSVTNIKENEKFCIGLLTLGSVCFDFKSLSEMFFCKCRCLVAHEK